jgi:putative membrane protein
MHHQEWHDGWGGGTWAWIPMALMMAVFWGGLIWLGIALLRRTGNPAHPHSALPAPPPPEPPMAPHRPSPADILAERLARGEIDPDDYRQRLAALQGGGPAAPPTEQLPTG